jgi:hypothetical protein
VGHGRQDGDLRLVFDAVLGGGEQLWKAGPDGVIGAAPTWEARLGGMAGGAPDDCLTPR